MSVAIRPAAISQTTFEVTGGELRLPGVIDISPDDDTANFSNDPSAGRFFDPMTVTETNIGHWISGWAVGLSLENEPQEVAADRASALYRILALRLISQRNKDEGGVRRARSSGCLPGMTPQASQEAAERAESRVRQAGGRILAAYCQSIGVEPPQRREDATLELMSRFISFSDEFGGRGEEAVRCRYEECLRLGRIVADTLHIKLVSDLSPKG